MRNNRLAFLSFFKMMITEFDGLVKSRKSLLLSFPRRRESSDLSLLWIPACAGIAKEWTFYKFIKFSAVCFLISLCALPASAGSMSSSGYEMRTFTQNRGAGAAFSENYNISQGMSSRQPVGDAESETYTLQADILDSGLSTKPSCSIFINRGNSATKQRNVELGLVCGDPDGCSKFQLSNNGFSWSEEQTYTTIVNDWPLSINDGDKQVFVRFKDGVNEWSASCSAAIVLDTRAPTVTATPLGGTYMDPQPVTLTASETATIYYTTDGTEPTTASTVFNGAINVASNMTIRFFAVDAAGNAGPVATETYTVCTGTNLTISGAVCDAVLNQSIPLALITLSNGSTAATSSAGTFSFTGMSHGEYTIQSVKVSAAGYSTYQKKIQLCQSNIDDLEITLTRIDTTFGGDTSSGYGSGPVNTSTGNFTHKVKDFAIPGRGLPFSFERGYNSQDDINGPLGYGWNHNYNIALTTGASNDVTVKWGDGRTETWVYDTASAKYIPRYGVFNVLVKNADNTYAVTLKDMSRYNFKTGGQLTGIIDENGNSLTMNWTGSLLTSVTDTVGRVITFTYDGSNRLVQVMDPIGRTQAFAYDAGGNLVSSTDLGGRTTTYQYDANHQMTAIVDPKGNAAITNVYDDLRKVVSTQRDALGGQTLYSYDEETKTTQIIDPLGNVSYHHFDDLLRLTREDDARGFSAVYHFNDRGSMDSVTDKNGNTTTYAYDDRGNVTTKTEPLGRITSATFDQATDNPLTRTDARGYTTVFTYDAKGNLKTVTDPLGKVTTYDYDEYGQLWKVTNALGAVTTYSYDLYGNRVGIRDPLGNVSTFSFDMVGRTQTETMPAGRGMFYEYDPMDRILSITDALGGTSNFTYDINGNKTAHLDARGFTTAYVYDKKNRLISKTLPMGGAEEYTWDFLDRRTAVKNPKGAAKSVVYDALGSVLQEVDAAGNRVVHTYDGNGNRLSTTDGRGYTTYFTYDALNRLAKKTDPLNNEELYEYDLNGNRTKVTDPQGHITQFVYDELNRLTRVIDHLGNTVINAYDDAGRLSRVTDARGGVTRFEYDLAGRMKKVTDTAGGIVEAGYDELGNRTSMTDAHADGTQGNTTQYEYDVLNRLTAEVDPLGNRRELAYDAVGNLIRRTDARGTVNYTFDKNSRLTGSAYPDSTLVTYAYDANGNRTGIVDGMGAKTYAYDVLDRLASVTDPFSLKLNYTYDPNGNRLSTRYPGAGSKSVFYTYDALNRLTEVQDWSGVTTTYEYDSAGRLAGQVMGNGATVVYSYDDAGRLTGKSDLAPGGAVVASYSHTLDANGNRTSVTMDQPLVPKPSAVQTSFAYDSANRILSGGGATYAHDGSGRRISREAAGLTTQYAYNYDDRLTGITSGGTTTQQYRYDSLGHRYASLYNGVETRYLLDAAGGMETVLAEMDANNAVRKYYVYGDGLLYSVNASTNERLYYHYDPLGSTVAVTDSLANITDKYAYLPFGELSGSETTHSNPFTYVGKFGVMQEPNGLYFMRARFYDPETRRFMSVDPVKGKMGSTQSISQYAYVSNNPLLNVDPKGTFGVESLLQWGITEVLTPMFVYSVCSIPGSACHDADRKALAIKNGKLVMGISIDVMTFGATKLERFVADKVIDTFLTMYKDEVINGLFSNPAPYAPKYDGSAVPGSAKQNFNYDYVDLGDSNSEPSISNNTEIAPDTGGSSGSNNGVAVTATAGRTIYDDTQDPNSWYSIKKRAQERKEMDRQRNQARLEERKLQARERAHAKAEREEQKRQKREALIRAATDFSKYAVLIVDMEKMPAFATGNTGKGVYGKR